MKTDFAFRFFFGSLIFALVCVIVFLVSMRPAEAAVSSYVRTPSGTPVDYGVDIVVSFDYEAGDTTGFAKTAVALFDETGEEVACEESAVVSGVGGSEEITLSGVAPHLIYKVKWGLISSGAPTYPFCANTLNHPESTWNSTQDAQTTLEEGEPAFEIAVDEGGGGEGTSTPQASGPTEEDKAGLLIALLVLFAGSFGSAYWLVRRFV